jgi:hypothetical protein
MPEYCGAAIRLPESALVAFSQPVAVERTPTILGNLQNLDVQYGAMN